MNCDCCGKYTSNLSGFCDEQCERRFYASLRRHEEELDRSWA